MINQAAPSVPEICQLAIQTLDAAQLHRFNLRCRAVMDEFSAWKERKRLEIATELVELDCITSTDEFCKE